MFFTFLNFNLLNRINLKCVCIIKNRKRQNTYSINLRFLTLNVYKLCVFHKNIYHYGVYENNNQDSKRKSSFKKSLHYKL